MLRLIPIFSLLIAVIPLIGQPVIGVSVLPEIGDTILMASDNLPENIAILGRGKDQEWDLTKLQSAFTQKIVVQAPDKKVSTSPFKQANLLMEETAGVKSYFKKDNHSLTLLGSTGLDPMAMGVQTKTHFEKPIKMLHFPLKYGNTSEEEGYSTFTVAVEKLPKEVLYSLPVTPDSVRFRCFITQKKEVDAAGILSLPDNTYNVLREKWIEDRKYEIDIKVGNWAWQNITESIEDSSIKKTQSIQSYHFYSNDMTSKLAVAYMKPNGVNPEVVYYSLTAPLASMRVSNGRPDIYAYPNPAINDVRFEFSNLAPSVYSLKIYNILGVVVYQEDYKLNGFKTIKVDISKLKKGTYLYSLSNAKGKTIATRRLMVIRP